MPRFNLIDISLQAFATYGSSHALDVPDDRRLALLSAPLIRHVPNSRWQARRLLMGHYLMPTLRVRNTVSIPKETLTSFERASSNSGFRMKIDGSHFPNQFLMCNLLRSVKPYPKRLPHFM